MNWSGFLLLGLCAIAILTGWSYLTVADQSDNWSHMFINAKIDAACQAVTDACPYCAQSIPLNMPRGSYHTIFSADGTEFLIPCTAIDQRHALMKCLIGEQATEGEHV